ncbi:MAG: Haloacetate dehalogenase [Bryobacterales bacterium]|nr:Haloacetate dehalogenase [Bryobacterales bacterium]
MSEQRTRRQLVQQAALAAGAALVTKRVSAQTSGESEAWKKIFPAGFRNERIKTSGAEINTVIGGSGPPLLMFHGAPQSLITWRLIAPDLAKEYTVVLGDLRGYGDSSKPADQPDHSQQSKRPMALDGVEVMEHLGFRQFRMVGHDRGGRVGRRMALDHPDRVIKLAVLDIIPAHYLYSHVNMDFVQAYFHWFNYLRPAPGPENELLAQNTGRGGGGRGAPGGGKAGGGDEIAALVQAEYARHNSNPAMLHAMCEDYRASASIDLKIDEADIKAGKKIKCPLLALWAAQNRVNKIYDVLPIWKEEGVKVSGKELPGSHSLQESVPKETLAELQAFLRG